MTARDWAIQFNHPSIATFLEEYERRRRVIMRRRGRC